MYTINKKLILFGATSIAEKMLKTLPQYIFVSYICDNDKSKQGSTFAFDGKNVPIYSPEKLFEEDCENTIVLITSRSEIEISKQLDLMGITFYYARQYIVDYEKIESNASKIDLVSSLMSDEFSKKLYIDIIEYRRNGKIDYSLLCDDLQYFKKDIFKFTTDEVYVDAGAFVGDTIEGFIKMCDGKYSHIYAYEPDRTNFEAIVAKNFDYKKITVFPCGVYNCETELSFSMALGAHSKIDSKGMSTIKTSYIDRIQDRITFIKMDVEGAEIEALWGAKNTIEKYHPKLAICLYHKTEHLWEIPLLINNWGDYNFFVRHHHFTNRETVLYASPKNDIK